MAAPEESPTPKSALRASPERGAIVLVLGGRITRCDVPRLCERVRELLEGGDADLVVCDVGALIDPDVVAVDALCRLQLTARRLGGHVRLRHACDELRELLALSGLGDVVPPCAELGVEPREQAEERKQPGRVQEEGDPDNLSA